jgi:hypothetical protein
MKRFYITAIRNAGKAGRAGWMVDYAVRDPEQKGRWKRRQNMFLDRERAEDFLEEARREFLDTQRVELAKDRLFHCNVLRAAKVLSDVPGAAIEAAARLMRECRSARERRGGKFEEPRDRKIELSPRSYLGLVHEARECGMSLSDLVNGIVWGHLEERSRRGAEQRRLRSPGRFGTDIDATTCF